MSKYSDPHEIPEIKFRDAGTGKKESKMWRYFQRTQWSRPIRRIAPATGAVRYFASIQEAAEGLADEMRQAGRTVDPNALIGNIRSGAMHRREHGFGMRYKYKWEFCELADVLKAGADCI